MIVIIQLGSVKIYVASISGGVQEIGDETQFTTKSGGKTSLGPSYFVL